MNKISSLNRWKIEITWKAKKSNYLSVIIKLWKDLYRCNQMSNAYSSISFAINFRMKMKFFNFFGFGSFHSRIELSILILCSLQSWFPDHYDHDDDWNLVFFHQTKLSACVCVGQEKMKKNSCLIIPQLN